MRTTAVTGRRETSINVKTLTPAVPVHGIVLHLHGELCPAEIHEAKHEHYHLLRGMNSPAVINAASRHRQTRVGNAQLSYVIGKAIKRKAIKEAIRKQAAT